MSVSEHGGLDIFFANAGISGGFASISEQTAEDWAEILRVNLIGPFLAIKYAAPVDRAARRRVDHLHGQRRRASARAPGGAAYSASKAGVINLVQTAAQQLSGTGVRVNAICPGLIETGMTKPIYDMAREQRPGGTASASSTRSRRGGEPERDRPRRAVPRLRRIQLRQRRRRWSSTAGCRAATRRPGASTSGCCSRRELARRQGRPSRRAGNLRAGSRKQSSAPILGRRR